MPPNALPSYTLTSNYNPGHKFSISATVVEYVARDELGNNATHTFTITVIGEYLVFINGDDGVVESPKAFKVFWKSGQR